MKIPDSIRIGGVEYLVEHVDYLNNGVNMAYGHIDYDNGKIELSSTAGNSHERQCITLWHEILHGIRNHACLEIENEEQVVDVLSRGIYQVLQDNGRKFFDIKEESHENQT